MVIAQKIEKKEIFHTTPQQYDYTVTWNEHKSIENKSHNRRTKIKLLYRKIMPFRARFILRNIYNIFFTNKIKEEGLGEIDPKIFTKIEF